MQFFEGTDYRSKMENEFRKEFKVGELTNHEIVGQ